MHTHYDIAVIGAGPAGLSCAYHLARLGHEVTIMSRNPPRGSSRVNDLPFIAGRSDRPSRPGGTGSPRRSQTVGKMSVWTTVWSIEW